MRLKRLESALSSIQREFPNPNITLEQYPTSPQLAAAVVQMALEKYGDVGEGRTVLDLGCGTGMLGLACAMVETDCVYMVDCDEDALQVARENASLLFDVDDDDSNTEASTRLQFVLAQVAGVVSADQKEVNYQDRNSKRSHSHRRSHRGGRGRSRAPPQQQQRGGSTAQVRQLILSDKDAVGLRSKCVDTVVTNPPFGTKGNAGMDLRFLRTATRLARRAVYSFHKTSTRNFLIRQVRDVWGMQIEVVAEMRFELPPVYRFHKEKSVDIEVDLVRIDLITHEREGGP